MPGKLTEQPPANAGTEADLGYVVQSGESRKQTRTQLRAGILSAWQSFIRTFLASADTSEARAAIGVAIGSNVQEFDADLQALAQNSTDGILTRTGAGTVAARTISGTANKIAVTNGNGVAGNPALTLPDAVTLVTPTVTGLLSCTGGQIKFPATQIPSADPNTLDDYETGTWTPTITFATPGDLNVVYSAQNGFYTKVGRLVQYSALVLTTTFTYTTATGTLRLAGLPFSAASTPPSSLYQWTGLTSAVTTPQILGRVSTTNLDFGIMNIAAGTVTAMTQANAPTAVQKGISLGGTYHV